MSSSTAQAALLTQQLSLRERLTLRAKDDALIDQLTSMREMDPQVDSLLKGFAHTAASGSQPARSPDDLLPPSRQLLIAGVDNVTESVLHQEYGCVGTTPTFPLFLAALQEAFGGNEGMSEARWHAFLKRCLYSDVFSSKPFKATESRAALSQPERARDIGRFLSLAADLACDCEGPLLLLGFGVGVKLINVEAAGLGGQLGPTLPEGVGGNANTCKASPRGFTTSRYEWIFNTAEGTELGRVRVGETTHLTHIGKGEGMLSTLHLGQLLFRLLSLTPWDALETYVVVMPADYRPGKQLAKKAWSAAGALLPADVNYFKIQQGAAGARLAPVVDREAYQCPKCNHLFPPNAFSNTYARSARVGRCPPTNKQWPAVCGETAGADASFCRTSAINGCLVCQSRV